ncbi:MAG: hypothetical protein ABJ095_17230, partial [Nitratireductor sp.]
MDAYNRGFGAGINNEGINDTDGLGTIGSKIGRATVRDESDVDDGTPSVEAGFYALAYEMDAEVGTGVDRLTTGDTVIACRGAAAAGRTGFVRPRSRTPSAPARLRPGAGRGNRGRADRCRSRPPAA